MAEAVGVERSEGMRFAGRVGLVAVVGLAALLAIHPFGSTALYADGGAFLDHVGWFWIAIHLAGAGLLLLWPPLIAVWARHLETSKARFVGWSAAAVAGMGMAVGTLHLVATDTMTFVAFRDTYAAGNGSEAVTVAADLLLRLHASTLAAWVLSFWLLPPALMAWAAWLDTRIPRWFVWLGVVTASLQVAAISVTIAERQWTTLSEMGLFRTGATLFVVLMLTMTWSMRKEELATGVPAS